MNIHLRAKLACGLVELSASSFATGERKTDGRESRDVIMYMLMLLLTTKKATFSSTWLNMCLLTLCPHWLYSFLFISTFLCLDFLCHFVFWNETKEMVSRAEINKCVTQTDSGRSFTVQLNRRTALKCDLSDGESTIIVAVSWETGALLESAH